MQTLVDIILQSGRSAVDLALYILLPVMVVMLAFMKVLEARGVLARLASLVAPGLRVFGVPGSGAFAMLQLLLVSFAAPVATLAVQDRDGTLRRRIAATLAMVLAMSQANVIFPMTLVGLDLGMIVLTSIIGGLAASSLTYYVFARSLGREKPVEALSDAGKKSGKRESMWALMINGGQEAVRIVINAVPALLLAIFFVNLLRASGVIASVEELLTPALALLGLPPAAVLPIATKYMAGGTAMMGVTLDLIKEGALSAQEFNRMAGLLINPLDMVGVAVLAAAGPRVATVVRPAVLGAAAGVLLRGVMHLLIF